MRSMTRVIRWVLLMGMMILAQRARSQTTAFTYQGRLHDNGVPVHGFYDLRFGLFDANGLPLGQTLTRSAVNVVDGVFAVTLDFGDQFSGADRWLEIGVRAQGEVEFVALNSRRKLTAVPYAVRAAKAGSVDSVSVGTVAGVIPLALLPGAVVTNGESGVTLSGEFRGDGAGIIGLKLARLNSGGAIVPGNFNETPPSLSVGNTPGFVAAADVNGDGRLDLVCANQNGASLSILLNNGAGGFVLSSSPGVGMSPFGLAVADVNRDGKVDLVTANLNSASLTVLRNNGAGTFDISSSPRVDLYPFSVTAADFNGDGWVDLASANSYSGTLSVLLNTGAGSFAPATSIVVGDRPNSITTGDVNSDGRVDLICANMDGNRLTVLLNNGMGTFSPFSSLNVGRGPYGVTAADVNGDGEVDLISANVFDHTLTVLTNDGSGGFVPSATLSVGIAPASVVAADLNGDGVVDLATANVHSHTLTVLLNNGLGSFRQHATIAVGMGPHSVAAADLDGDGAVDLASANHQVNSLSVVKNSPKFSALYTGDGSSLKGLNAAEITQGVVANARLSSNVALRNGGNTFSSDQTLGGGTLDLSHNSRLSERLRFSGRGVVPDGNTASDGFSLLLGMNRPENRQLWMVDSARMARSPENPVVRVMLEGGNPAVDAIGTDGVTLLPMGFGSNRSLYLAVSGNVGIGTSAPGDQLHVVGKIQCETLAQTSDRNSKENIAAASPSEILAKVTSLPISTWKFKEGDGGRHLGPMAQDFHATFGLGANDTSIAAVDSDGVALAAIQGLNDEVDQNQKEGSVRIQRLEEKNAELRMRIEKLRRSFDSTSSLGVRDRSERSEASNDPNRNAR